MVKLQCEVCGGKLFGKPDGVFECEYCGMAFTKEWAQQKIQEIRGTVKIDGPVQVEGSVEVKGGVTKESLLRRGDLALEDKNWSEAKRFFDQALDIDPECAEAYLGKAMAEWECSRRSEITKRPFPDGINYQRARRYADAGFLRELDEIERLCAKKAEAELQVREAQEKRLRPIRERIAPFAGLVAIEGGTAFGIQTDGTLAISGLRGNAEKEMQRWRNVAAFFPGSDHDAGLLEDGTVVMVGDNEYGQCNVAGWRDITAVALGYWFTLGLRKDGTVVFTGSFTDDDDDELQGTPLEEWRDITAIAAGATYALGLRSDGTVLCYGDCPLGVDNVSQWRRIVAITTITNFSIGLRADGTVLMTGTDLDDCHYDVSGWHDIVALAGENDNYYLAGLRANGTVVFTGEDYGLCDTSRWRNIIAIAAGYFNIIGLRSDGTVVAAGRNEHGECDLDGWRLFHNMDSYSEERRAAHRAREDADRAREARIAALDAQRQRLQEEYRTLGLFSGKRKKELEARIAQLDAELRKLQGDAP